MERTQRLMTVALAVLALDGCRGSSQQAARSPSPTPTYRLMGHAGTVVHGAAAGAAAGAVGGAANAAGSGTIDRTLGGNRGSDAAGESSGRGGFGEAGAHGAGG